MKTSFVFIVVVDIGTLWTASAHIITAVIGSGVLSLAWSMAQLGWIAGPIVLICFSIVTYFTSTLLSDCYRSPDTVSGIRNYTYMDAVRANLGMKTSPMVYFFFMEIIISQNVSPNIFFCSMIPAFIWMIMLNIVWKHEENVGCFTHRKKESLKLLLS